MMTTSNATETRHVMFEVETDTIRQLPQNYCLMVRRDGQWRLDIDKASTLNAHSLRLALDDLDLSTASGDDIARTIADAFWL
jgi:hypothetical protein